MRKITENAHEAFNNNKKFKSVNTDVIIENGVTKMYLHGNWIAQKQGRIILISGGGYPPSNTTRERLNGFSNVKLRISKGIFILNEKIEWDGQWICITDMVS